MSVLVTIRPLVRRGTAQAQVFGSPGGRTAFYGRLRLLWLGAQITTNGSWRYVKTYRGRVFNGGQPTRSADSVVALRSASPRNTVLFSLSIRGVVAELR